MSRETDTSSSGAQGRGPTAYPSGTQPYGPAEDEAPEESTGAEASGTPTEDRKTETTLTTRIRINIPGSRPIPPVVVRTPVTESTDEAEPGGSRPGTDAPQQAAAPSSPLPVRPKRPKSGPAPAEPVTAAKERTSDWFAPRKAARGGAASPDGAAQGVPGARSAPGEPDTGGFPAGSGIPTAEASAGYGSGGPGPGEQDTGGFPLGGQDTGGFPAPGDTGGFPGPGDTASFPAVGDTGGFPVPGEGANPSDTGEFAAPGDFGTGGTGGYEVPGPLGGPRMSAGGPEGEAHRGDLPFFGPEGGPAGPTGGPVTGEGPLGDDGPEVRLPGGPGGPGGPGPARPLGDDTAVLTPQQPGPEPGRPEGNVSGHTLNSGIPVVPPAGPQGPFPPGGGQDGPAPQSEPRLPEPVQENVPASRPPKKKGRSKLVLLCVAVVGAAGIAYGAGLLLNHSDVPSGTTVLGVDIGGGTRDDAVQKLDGALGSRTTKPLRLSVDGENVELRPDQAGLALDTDATVRGASGSDYNPVSVIGSLFGGERVVEPVMPVDEEKLRVALERAAGGAGSATEGTIKFTPGKATAVYGKPGKGIDVDAAVTAVEEAYRTQVEKGSAGTVKLPTTTRTPKVPDAEVDRMMKSFGKPAMSGLVTVQTDAAHTVSFSPERSIFKFLSVRAVDGKLTEYYDLKALEGLYGSAFEGVTITKGDGSKKPVSPQDVASALGRALRGATPAERLVTIPTEPN
ncbi:hypothetical protein ACH4TU_09330 [Streptomyces physcomitrii]|uniref:hypothetical protein n=1 Tax=Streptomyces physcomitrii TaxID=2724184 RepID=UPI00058C8ACC